MSTNDFKKYTLEYIQSFKGIQREPRVGGRSAWHDVILKKWRLTVQLEETRYWFLSVFINDDGSFDKFSLDEEAASDSHYEFGNEAAVRARLYQPGDEELLLDEILARYVARNGGRALLGVIWPSVTAQFHF